MAISSRRPKKRRSSGVTCSADRAVKASSRDYCLTDTQRDELFNGRPTTEFRKIGCGAAACAYNAPKPDRVVKFTTDPADVASLIQAQDSPHVVRVYDAYTLKPPAPSPPGKPRTKPIYAVVAEKVKLLPRTQQTVKGVGLADKGLNRNLDIVTGCKGNKLCEEIYMAHESILAQGVFWSDIHDGNIGRDRKGTLKVLDLGFTSAELREQPVLLRGADRKLRKLRRVRRIR